MKNLKLLREKRNLTQSELAAELKVKNNSISDWETGKNCPHLDIVIEIANYFGVTIDYLVGREPESGLIYVHKDPELLPFERELVNLFKDVKPELRETTMDIIRTIVKKS